ncbi:MAG: hypothetical protein ABS955_11865, partial [Stenotrophomonas maltophilia]
MNISHHSAPARNALTSALLAGLMLATAPALAQDAAATTELDKVNVTGSRIARTGFVTSSPVTAITAEEIR